MCDMQMQDVLFLPGARVVTRDGDVVVVVQVWPDGTVMGIGVGDRVPRPVRPVCDAFGGEHDAMCGLPIAA